MFPVVDYTQKFIIITLALVLIILSLYLTILLIRHKHSPMSRSFGTEIRYAKEMETIQETEALEEVEETEEAESLKLKRPTKGCLHYLGYLEKLSTSSFPYECLACPKIGECMGEKKRKEREKTGIDMSEYSVSTRIATTIEKTKNAAWKNLRGKYEQAVRGEQVPELYKLLKELGGKIKYNDWEYQCFERPVKMVVRTKIQP